MVSGLVNQPTFCFYGCFPIYASIPPSTYSICPFTKSDAEDERNTTGPARSKGVPHLFAGVFASIKESKGCLLPSGCILRSGAVCEVAIYPGPIPLH